MKKNYAIIIVLIFSLALFFLIALGGKNDKKTETEEKSFACIMDALICPDGSGVGRSGPQCEFTACPNQKDFLGELSEQGGKYFLIMASPEGIVGETTYSLPLEFSRVSNAIAPLLGKYVRVTGQFTTGNNLKVETIKETQKEAVTTGSIAVGESKTINGVRITVNNIVEDSRCPADATCIQAGKLVANVTLGSNTDKETLNMSDADAPKAFDVYKVSLISSAPYFPLASQPLPFNQYRLTFKVEKSS